MAAYSKRGAILMRDSGCSLNYSLRYVQIDSPRDEVIMMNNDGIKVKTGSRCLARSDRVLRPRIRILRRRDRGLSDHIIIMAFS